MNDATQTLDDLGKTILAVEIGKPGISSQAIAQQLPTVLDRKTIDHRRRDPSYQQALAAARMDAISAAAAEIKAAQLEAVQVLREMLKSGDQGIALAAAKILAKASLDAVETEAVTARESLARKTKPTVTVRFTTLMPYAVLGKGVVDLDGRMVPSNHPLVADLLAGRILRISEVEANQLPTQNIQVSETSREEQLGVGSDARESDDDGVTLGGLVRD